MPSLLDLAQAHMLDSHSSLPDQPLPGVDDQALAEIRQRLRAIAVERQEAEDRGDHTTIAELDEEVTQLERYISHNRGFGGRSRANIDPMKQPRRAVQKAIRRSLHDIAEQHDSLAHFLRDHISTGRECVYTPDSTAVWDL